MLKTPQPVPPGCLQRDIDDSIEGNTPKLIADEACSNDKPLVGQPWLTDQRLVVRTGFIGYQLRSVPLDRVVDVTLQASWWDRLWGLQHVQIRDMNSEVSSGTSRPGLRLIAVPEAESVTDVILNACPALGSETDRMDEVVVLLGALVDKAS